MKKSESFQDRNKAPTVITGFDELTRGGLFRGRITLPEGRPGSGNSILALQSLVIEGPQPVRRIIGNLSKMETILKAIGLGT